MTPTGRDNGLPRAARYVALVDVHPPVADHVLALLRDAGVTALAEPVAGDISTTTRAVAPTERPTERIHVDGEHVLLAQSVVRRALPGIEADFLADAARRQDEDAADRERRRRDELGAEEVDSLFAGIVAGFDATGDDPVPRWSVLEDAPAEEPVDEEPPPARPPLSSRLLRSAPRDDAPAPEEDLEGHFVPPPPPPLPEADRVTRLAWAALIGGPTLIILAALFGIGLESWLAFAALCLFVGGFATLVARMRDTPSQDDGWDDGAVL